jgi:serine/threonine-protein kinase
MGTPETRDQLIGVVLATDFRVIRQVGMGAFAKVYLAEQLSVGKRKIAIKVLHDYYLKVLKDLPFSNPLRREAIYLSMLKSPCFLSIYRTGKTPNGLPYIAMEFIEGRTMDKIIENGYIYSIKDLKPLASQLLSGIHEMHTKELINRDLKPKNLMIEDQSYIQKRVRIIDLGSCKSMLEDERIPRSEKDIIGTPAYMAPEQARREHVDEKSDIYSMGAIFYEMLTGSKAIHIKNPSDDDYIKYLQSDKPIPTHKIASMNPEIPMSVEEIINRALSRNSKERFQSAMEMCHLLVEEIDKSLYSTLKEKEKFSITGMFKKAIKKS